MKSLTEKQIKTLMHSYTAKGGSQHRKKRYRGLLNMINEIFDEEKIMDLDKIGKKQIVGYWRRHRAESEKTLNEKWSVLNVLFAKLNKPEPPRPNYRMTKYLVRKEKKRKSLVVHDSNTRQIAPTNDSKTKNTDDSARSMTLS